MTIHQKPSVRELCHWGSVCGLVSEVNMEPPPPKLIFCVWSSIGFPEHRLNKSSLKKDTRTPEGRAGKGTLGRVFIKDSLTRSPGGFCLAIRITCWRGVDISKLSPPRSWFLQASCRTEVPFDRFGGVSNSDPLQMIAFIYAQKAVPFCGSGVWTPTSSLPSVLNKKSTTQRAPKGSGGIGPSQTRTATGAEHGCGLNQLKCVYIYMYIL